MIALRCAVLVCLAFSMLVATPTARAAAGDRSCVDSVEFAVIALINDYRAENGVPPLWMSQTLSDAAEYHSASMATNGYFSHDLAAEGITWSQNMTNHGYSYNTWRGENLAGGQSSAEDVFAAWVNSSPHNAVMLNADFTAIGIGMIFSDPALYGWYWTTDFGGQVDAPAQLCDGGVAPVPAV